MQIKPYTERSILLMIADTFPISFLKNVIFVHEFVNWLCYEWPVLYNSDSLIFTGSNLSLSSFSCLEQHYFYTHIYFSLILYAVN